MISRLTRALDELLGNFYIAPTVKEYYEDTRVGARVLERDRAFVAAFISHHLYEALCSQAGAVRTLVEEGTFFVPYPRYQNRVSPQCAPRTDNPEDYVVRTGPDGQCRMYLRRDRAPRSSAVLCVGGMMAPCYLQGLAKMVDQDFHQKEAREIDHLEKGSCAKHTIVITRIYGGMLGPEDHLDNDLAALIKPFPEVIDEVYELGKKPGRSDTNPYGWISQHLEYALDHHAKYAWVSD
ncbi:hypothetical protein HYV71_01330 [Candidatus Uhrbacteria bacterium]|nr:hypothetical protein [Candidatus Uhrbacteria bacterium]